MSDEKQYRIVSVNEVKHNGLPQHRVKEYWDNRSAEQKVRTVGPQGSSLVQQNRIYQERFDFMRHRVPFTQYTLDFGCGIGRYSKLFDPAKYFGVDICESLLDYAKDHNPRYRYQLLSEPILTDIDFEFNIFFTSTVLQHNDDDSVKAILDSAKNCGQNNLVLCLYENTSKNPDKPHICFRTVDRYIELIRDVIVVDSYESWSHISHGEEHSLMVVETKDRR